jgi:hypothetical protein
MSDRQQTVSKMAQRLEYGHGRPSFALAAFRDNDRIEGKFSAKRRSIAFVSGAFGLERTKLLCRKIDFKDVANAHAHEQGVPACSDQAVSLRQ